MHRAVETKQKLFVCVAQDICQGKAIEDPTLMTKLLALSDSKTEYLPGYLPLVPGIPVILTQNIAIELGLINGSNGIFQQLVYQADFVTTDNLSDNFSLDAQYVHQPTYALIEMAKSKIECQLTDLQSNLIPILLVEQTFRININELIPKDKHNQSCTSISPSILYHNP